MTYESIPAGTRLVQILLNVSDLDRALDFAGLLAEFGDPGIAAYLPKLAVYT